MKIISHMILFLLLISFKVSANESVQFTQINTVAVNKIHCAEVETQHCCCCDDCCDNCTCGCTIQNVAEIDNNEVKDFIIYFPKLVLNYVLVLSNHNSSPPYRPPIVS